jgi:tRNA 2-thiouridine synthesizing protein D
MNDKPLLTFAFMDPPFENERTVTFFRILDAALKRDANVTVFAYEGAVALTFARQRQHGNGVHGRSLEEEAHPLTKDWVAGLQQMASQAGLQFSWINCGLCVDERGVEESIDGCPKGSPADFWKAASAAANTLVIATR